MSKANISPGRDSSIAGSSNTRKVPLRYALLNLLRSTWNPLPLKVPKIDPNLEELPFLERVTEVLRFQVLSVEYGLSSRGGLREWARVVSVISLALAFPLFLIVPLVTIFLSAAVTWTAMLFQIMTYLLFALLTLIVIVTVALIGEQALYKALEIRAKEAEKRRKKKQ